MLVVTRKLGERIQIGDDITVTIVRISGNSVRVGIEAPAHMEVVREEIARRLAGEHDPVGAAVGPE
jgi:carbon storage regulator